MCPANLANLASLKKGLEKDAKKGGKRRAEDILKYRVDMDYSARRLAQKYMDIVDPDFYEWETHILFDDAFELGDNDENEQVVNQFVKQLVRIIDDAGSFVHCKKIKVKPPVMIPTPYGGRLVWTLPGKSLEIGKLEKIQKTFIFDRKDQNRLPLEGQGQDSSQEALVPMHVHVLPPGLQTHGTPHPGREETSHG